MNIETELIATGEICKWKLSRDNGFYKSVMCRACNGTNKECNDYVGATRTKIKYGYSDYMK